MPNTARTVLLALFATVIGLGVVAAVWPVTPRILGTDVSCGPAVVAWLEYAGATDPIKHECFRQGGQRALVGIGIAVAGVVALIIAAVTMPRYTPWWDGQQWRSDAFRPRPPAPPAAR